MQQISPIRRLAVCRVQDLIDAKRNEPRERDAGRVPSQVVEDKLEQGFQGDVAKIVGVIDPPTLPLRFKGRRESFKFAPLRILSCIESPAHFLWFGVAREQRGDLQDQENTEPPGKSGRIT